jgi:hypothetical protein
MRESLTSAGELTGAALVTYGCHAISAPLGFIVGGTLLALFSWLVDR